MFQDLEAFRKTPLSHDPFEFLIVRDFVRADNQGHLARDFPPIAHPGSYPVSELHYGPAFDALLAELRGPEFRAAVADKFGLDLSARPEMITIRGHCRSRDGRIHTDTASKLISILIYLNERWEEQGGRLRLLRSRDDLDDVVAEVPPEWGTMVAFRRSDASFHGHRPYSGGRRVIQVNWVRDQAVVDHEIARHRRSAWFKRVFPWARWIGY